MKLRPWSSPLTANALNSSTINASPTALDLAPFHLGDVLGDTLHPLALRAREKGLELSLDIAPTVPDEVSGDSAALRQIVINLVGNAIKFTTQGDVTVSISAEVSLANQTVLQLAVRDTGAGMKADEHAAILSDLRQVGGSSNRSLGGVGLGLSTTARLVHMMGGRIWSESMPDHGSTFYVILPFVAVRARSVAPAQHQRDLRNLTVLVVDADTTTSAMLENQLTRWQMLPTRAPTCAAAIEQVARARRNGRAFDLLLVDAAMPEMDGFALMEYLGKNDRRDAPAIMMLSAPVLDDDVKRCRALGVELHLVKPVRGYQLLDSISRTLDRRRRAVELPTATTGVPDNSATSLTGIRVLLAEDNVVNRKLASALLLRRGAIVTLAVDGIEAVAACKAAAFDIVLMDVEMPELDGFGATRRIRGMEAIAPARGRTPIIALTAREASGDRDRCLEAGMDGYATKPIRAPQLFAEIARLLPTPTVESMTVDTVRSRVFDLAGLRQTADGDDELVADVIRLFIEDTPLLVAGIDFAIANGDRAALCEAAHALKGAAASLTAVDVAAAASSLEVLAMSANSLATAPALAVKLHDDLSALNRVIHRVVAGAVAA